MAQKKRIPTLAPGGELALFEIDLRLTALEDGQIPEKHRWFFVRDIKRRIKNASIKWPDSFALKDIEKRFRPFSAAEDLKQLSGRLAGLDEKSRAEILRDVSPHLRKKIETLIARGEDA